MTGKNRTRPGPGSDKVHLELLVKPAADQLFADRREALGGWRGGDGNCLHGGQQGLEFFHGKTVCFYRTFKSGLLPHLLRRLFPDPAEIFNEKINQFLVACRRHPLELANLYPMGVRLYCHRAGNHFLAHPLERERFIIQFDPEPGMGVDYRRVPEIFEQLLPCGHGAPELDLHPRAVSAVPFKGLLGNDIGLVRLDPDLDLKPLGRFFGTGAGYDHGRKAAGQLGVQHRRRDPDALLAARLADLVEPRPVEKFAKHIRDLSRDDTRPVVLDNDTENIGTGLFYADENIREHLRLFAGVQSVVHGLLDGGDNPPRGGVKTKEMLVLLKKFCDADAALLFGELVSESQAHPPR